MTRMDFIVSKKPKKKKESFGESIVMKIFNLIKKKEKIQEVQRQITRDYIAPRTAYEPPSIINHYPINQIQIEPRTVFVTSSVATHSSSLTLRPIFTQPDTPEIKVTNSNRL